MSESKNLWGGRFEGKTDPFFADFNRSFGFDRRLFEAEVTASIAHCNGLLGAGVLSAQEAAMIRKALEGILEHGSADAEYFEKWPQEDIHTFIEAHLLEMAGDTGRKLHTGRSRNDQVATDLRLWLRKAIDDLGNRLRAVQKALLELAEANRTVAIPGYTHLQRAQPVLLAHWALAYFEMLRRDRERVSDLRKRVNIMPLGSAALAGTSFPIDREAVARELGFDEVSRNSLDAVSDRDFCVEFTSACSLVMVHLSRLAEDIILYSTTEFAFFELSDAVATGSSLMPQKKNPDSMELVRGKAGRVFGHLQALLTTLKGLPLAYNKDMQEDKEEVVDSFDTTSACLQVTATVLSNIRVNEERARNAAASGYMNATELADYLVRKDVPFREAHDIVGRIVLRAIELGVELQDMAVAEMQTLAPLIEADVHDALQLDQTMGSHAAIGGTAPARVSEALVHARSELNV